MEPPETVSYKRKPRKCSKCGSNKIADIQYGMPAYSRKLERAIEAGKIILGGCCISDNDPSWQCTECGLKFFRE
ncbi:MAG: hypothetical protein H8E17_17440 [Deltaproteobacteria bacterium]|nr:hypothetical protein [Deltaproteobacteria bacterium]